MPSQSKPEGLYTTLLNNSKINENIVDEVQGIPNTPQHKKRLVDMRSPDMNTYYPMTQSYPNSPKSGLFANLPFCDANGQLPTPPMMPSFNTSPTSNHSYSSNKSPGMFRANFPDSPSMLPNNMNNQSNIMLSPNHQYSLSNNMMFHTGYSPTMQQSYQTPLSPRMMYSGPQHSDNPQNRRQPVLKIPVTPKRSPKMAPVKKTMNLPCYLDKNENIVVQEFVDSSSFYWKDMMLNAKEFLKDTNMVDTENITIIEIKTILRKYSSNATGKKHVLLERIEKLRSHLLELQARENVESKVKINAIGSAAEAVLLKGIDKQ